MLKRLFTTILFLLTILIISIATIEKINNNKNIKYIKKKYYTNIKVEKKPIGKLYIKKININNDIYSIDSKENNIEENVTILKESTSPENKKSIMILAAHSGIGKIAYFEHLNELNINDIVSLKYKEKSYKYIVTNIYEENKNGKIHIKKNNDKQLVLTTCSPNNKNKQLIVICTIKEP